MFVVRNAGVAGANLVVGWLNDCTAATALNPAGYQPIMLYFAVLSALGFACAIRTSRSHRIDRHPVAPMQGFCSFRSKSRWNQKPIKSVSLLV